MSTKTLPTRLLAANEVAQVRGLITDRGEKAAAALLGVSHLTQVRALSGLTLEATTVGHLRQRLEALRTEVAQ
jgi:hypothetical protein